MTRPLPRVLALATLTALAACVDADSPLDGAEDETSQETGGQAEGEDEEPSTTQGDPTTGGETATNDSCSYNSPFTGGAECRDYLGAGWTEPEVNADCSGVSGTVSFGQGCASEEVLGRCSVDAGTDFEVEIVIYGTDADSCELQATGCETFGGGTWLPEPICDGGGGGGGGGGDQNVFIQPSQVCVDPLDGEPPGQSANGEVCTWQAISASTEEGRRFDDYASCDVVRSQRPYYPLGPAPSAGQDDPRLDDPEYLAELDWVRSQVEASACVCCHSDDTPIGASNWSVDAPGNWMDSFYDSGLALGANWVNSVSFGAFDPADNNGFNRIDSGFPTTDPERMVAFFVAELEHRGRSEADFADAAPFGGPLYDQLVYEPGACENGEGVAEDGTITWTGGAARYVYVLEPDAMSPTVPPNLDLPDGTLWRIDVPWDGGDPISTGELSYGTPPAGMSQRFPVDGAPPQLIPGNEYYLYVTRDVGIPITRCLFVY